MQCWLADERNRNMKHWWHVTERKTELTEEKSVQVPQNPQQIPNGLEWDRTRFSTLTAQELPYGVSARTPFPAAADEFNEEILK